MINQLDGPIPGENYTSDTRNYPWHRPPEHTDIDEAIETAFKKLTEDQNAFGMLTLLEAGVTVTQVTSMFLISGIGNGKWTPDFALLLAGPIAHIIYLMAKGYGIDCELGFDRKKPNITSSFLKGKEEATKQEQKRIQSLVQNVDIESVKEKAKGFVSMTGPASDYVQDKMLGGG